MSKLKINVFCNGTMMLSTLAYWKMILIFLVLTKELYYSKIDAVKDNFERIQNFPVDEDYIYKNYFL